MAIDIDTLTKLIQTPPRSLIAGTVLFGLVWGLFRGIESVLADDTKFEIAVWLVGVKPIGSKIKAWSKTIFTMYERIYGKWPKWPFSLRSNVAVLISSCLSASLIIVILASGHPIRLGHLTWSAVGDLGEAMLLNMLAVHVSYTNTTMYKRLRRFARGPIAIQIAFLLVFQFWEAGVPSPFTITSVLLSGKVASILSDLFGLPHFVLPWETTPLTLNWRVITVLLANSFMTSIWLWLFVISGLLLIVARRFDIGFQWFNRKFDIEKKPLSAIGLVAGALVAMVYWGFAIGSWIVKK
jgi:hypothetical protein